MSPTKRLFAATLAMLGMLVAVIGFGSAAQAYGGLAPTLSLSQAVIPAGNTEIISGNNYTPNASVALTLHSAGVSLGSVTTNGQGSFSTARVIPASTVPGAHEISSDDPNTAADPDVSVALTVTTAAGQGGGGGGGGSGGGGGLAGTGVAVIGIGAVGIVLLVGGGLMLMAGRRRKVTTI